jgi:hypothetical protein
MFLRLESATSTVPTLELPCALASAPGNLRVGATVTHGADRSCHPESCLLLSRPGGRADRNPPSALRIRLVPCRHHPWRSDRRKDGGTETCHADPLPAPDRDFPQSSSMPPAAYQNRRSSSPRRTGAPVPSPRVLSGQRKLAGRALSMADGLIAATALEHGLTVATSILGRQSHGPTCRCRTAPCNVVERYAYGVAPSGGELSAVTLYFHQTQKE